MSLMLRRARTTIEQRRILTLITSPLPQISTKLLSRNLTFSSYSTFHKKNWRRELHSSNPIILISILCFLLLHKSSPTLILVFSTPHISIIESSESVTIHGVLNWMLYFLPINRNQFVSYTFRYWTTQITSEWSSFLITQCSLSQPCKYITQE